LTHKAIPGAVNGSNFGKTSISSYKGFINKKTKIKFFDLAQKIFSFRVVLGLRGKIVPPPILAQSKSFFLQNLNILT
jgi:hypothetical protein